MAVDSLDPDPARSPATGSREHGLAGLILIVGLWLFWFWPVLFGPWQFGFRDTATMYYPLYHWMDAQIASGTIPLWNPWDDFGQSVVGEASSGLCYPGRFLLLWPGASFDTRFAWFVALHVLVAALTARWAARAAGCRMAAASLVAISYAFGGTVVFQTCNLIYLIGAAWLPLGVGAAWRCNREDRPTWLVLAAIAMSQMVLGGDPQMALLAGLMVAFLVGSGWQRSLTWRLGSAIGVCLLALALSAVQVFPSWYAARASERATSDLPSNLYGAVADGEFGGLVREPPAGTHAAAIYEFSFAPWRVLEFVWPNLSGRFDFVSESNWSSWLPGADRLWTPTVYFGIAVLLLAIWQCRFRVSRGSPAFPDWQLTWLGLLLLVASFGWYGIGWLINELNLMRGGTGTGSSLGRSVGGLYWLLVCLVPGFEAFRYPSKLLVVACLMFCLLAGRGLDHWATSGGGAQDRNLTRLQQLIRGVLVASLVGFIVSMVAGGWLPGEDQRNQLWQLALASVTGPLLHTTLVLGLVVAIFRFSGRYRRRVVWQMVLLTAADLLVANLALSGLVPRAAGFPGLPDSARSVYRMPGDAAPRASDLAEQYRLDRTTLLPRFHLLGPLRQVGSFSSLEPADLWIWKQELQRLEPAARQTVLASCGVNEIWHLTARPGGASVVRTPLDSVPEISLIRNWTTIPELAEQTRLAINNRTRQVLKQIADLGPATVIVESDRSSLQSTSPVPALRVEDQLRTLTAETGRIELQADCEDRCLLVICGRFDTDWTVRVVPEGQPGAPAEWVRCNRVLRGLLLEPGTFRIEMTYWPRGLTSGLLTSGLAWLLLIVGLAVRLVAGTPARADRNIRSRTDA